MTKTETYVRTRTVDACATGILLGPKVGRARSDHVLLVFALVLLLRLCLPPLRGINTAPNHPFIGRHDVGTENATYCLLARGLKVYPPHGFVG
jgi:hypothetical protein